MSHLALWLLGPFQATLDGQPITGFESTKVRALLAYLAVESERPHARTALAGLLWPDRPDANALTNLRRALANLRQALGDRDSSAWPPLLLVTRRTIQFNNASEHWVDVQRLEEHHRLAQRQDSGDDAEGRALGHLQSAADLCRGSFLAGFSVASAPFEEWAVLKREQLNRQAWSLLQRLATFYERSGDYGRAVTCVRRQLHLEPWHEECLRQLMRLLALSGQRGAALVEYEAFRDLLHKELDIEPTGETTALYRQIHDGPLDPTRVAGVKGPAPTQPPPLRTSTQTAVPFVGREVELNRLNTALDSALAGRGRFVFVTGDAGSGKTTLLREFARRASAGQQGLAIAWGQCDAGAGVGDPYLPFRGIFSGLVTSAAESERAPSITLPGLVRVLLDHGPNLIGRLVPRTSLLQATQRGETTGSAPWQARLDALLQRRSTPSSSSDPSQTRLSEQARDVLQTLSEQTPLILLLDDLQWADEASISLLYYLGRRIEASRILIAGAYRPADVALGRRQPGAGWARHPLDPAVLELQRRYGEIGLALRPEGRPFVDALLDAEPNRLDESFRTTFVDHTNGHPLFTVELLHSLQEQDGVVQDGQGKWTTGPRLDWDQMPARVEAVIAERVRRLDPDCQELLAAASVQGEEFAAQVVAQVLNLDEDQVISMLSGPLCHQHRLVLPQSASHAGDRLLATYRFRHNLFQRFLYNGLDTVEHARLHQATARALEAVFAGQPEALTVLAPQLARHYREAGLTAAAISHLRSAASHSVDLSANREAIAHLEEALTLLRTLPERAERDEQELALRLAMHVPLLASESYGSARLRRSIERMQALCQRLEDTPDLLRVHIALAAYFTLRAESQTALAHAEQALALAQQQDSERYVVWIHQVIGLNHLYLGRSALTLKHMQPTWDMDDAQRQAMLPVQGTDPHVVGHTWSAWAHWLLGYPGQSQQHSLAGLAKARSLGHAHTLAVALLLGGVHLVHLRREPDGLPALLADLETLTARHEMPHIEALTRLYDGWLLARRRPQEIGTAIEQIQQSLMDWQATGLRSQEPLYHAILAEVLMTAGRLPEAQRSLDRALSLAEDTGERVSIVEALRLQGDLLVLQGEDPDAADWFHRALDTARLQQARSLELRSAVSLARLWHKQGDVGKQREAYDILSEVYNWFSEGFDTVDLCEARTLLKEMALVL